MKIIQSFWTKPGLKEANFNISDRNMGGWVDKRFNYFSWALSCLQLKKFYGRVELITDSAGFDLFVRKLSLPYDDVKVALDELDLNEYHYDLWALGKLKAYSLQEEPFIHVDGDVFIFEKFSNDFENSDLLAQNAEYGFNYYEDAFKKIEESFDYIPQVLLSSRKKNDNKVVGVNAGIVGGKNVGFFQEYSACAFEFVNRNRSKLAQINIGLFNNVFEQFLFYAMAEKMGISITYYLKNVNHAFDGLAELTGVPRRVRYVHTVGVYKRIAYIGDLIANRLLMDYPEYYFKIINLLRTNQL
ncbi:MAG: DUF6734 family protein [Cyclobacteriaceae bacterium]